MVGLTASDPEIAAATFRKHLNDLWDTERVKRLGWERREIDPLNYLAILPAKRASDDVDHYFIRLGAKYYDLGPPIVNFVEEDGETIAANGSKRFPVIANAPSWFGLHHSFTYPPPRPQGQLVCFSFSADYYLSAHSPTDSQRWIQGKHTVAMTLNRIAEILSPPYYQQPSG